MVESGPGPAVAPSGGDAELGRRVDEWLRLDPDPETRAELAGLRDRAAWEELAGRFAGRLTFGTAGLRAELGAGPMRMNRLVVRQAAAGLVRYLQQRGRPDPLVVIGYDARHKSDVFAEDSAAVVVAAGGRAVRFRGSGPTPLLAFAIRFLGADAGVMVTASHNPPADNGYKVYLGDGAQIVPPVDREIAACIEAVGLDIPLTADIDALDVRLGDEVEAAYLATVVGQLTPSGARSVRVAYTPMHGVGARLAVAAFREAGFAEPAVVAEQADPDPRFPTLPFPNPEEPGALDLGLALARATGADVLLANDPDADRLGVAVPADPAGPARPAGPAADPAAWQTLSGNEIGVLLADHLLRHRDREGERLVVTTVVSSRLLARLAEHHGVHYAETLTGFKWIVRPGIAHPAWSFVLGYEEALGYAVGPAVRDKDGIAAALVFAELVAALRAEGRTVHDRLEELARRFGLHATAGFSIRFADAALGARRAASVMARLREDPPVSLGGQPLIGHRDLLDDPAPAAADVLLWDLADGGRVVLRPSGTEPKLKAYVEVVEPVPVERRYVDARLAAGRRLDAVRRDLEAVLHIG